MAGEREGDSWENKSLRRESRRLRQRSRHLRRETKCRRRETKCRRRETLCGGTRWYGVGVCGGRLDVEDSISAAGDLLVPTVATSRY